MKPIPYEKILFERLKKDPEEAAGYLNAAYEEGGPKTFLVALKDVIEAYGGMSFAAQKAKLNRVSLYRMLSRAGNPELQSLEKLLQILGLRLMILPLAKRR
ncbi:MAG: transcriptional regulator [Deltaproteobacteria bacterium]|nr:transcriptional regulator [Deltaproteobacteria bacterium]